VTTLENNSCVQLKIKQFSQCQIRTQKCSQPD